MLLIVLLLPTIQAALTCTSASGDVGGFKACTFDALGSGGASDTSSACAGNTGDAYNACICQAASNVVKWYNIISDYFLAIVIIVQVTLG